MIPYTKIINMSPGNKIPWLAFAISFIVLTFACAGKEEVKGDSFFDEWKARAEESSGYSPGSSGNALDNLYGAEEEASKNETEVLEQEKDAGAEWRLPAQKVTMRMRSTDVGVILRALARNAGQNIMMTDEVKGIINIDVRETPWDQVFRSILSTRGFVYTWEGDILRVMTLGDIRTEEELLEANQNLTIKKKELDLKISSLNSKAKMIEPLLTWIYHIKYADAETLRENLWEFLSSGYVSQYSRSREGASIYGAGARTEEGLRSSKMVRGAILVDPHTNSLVIQAIKSDIARLKEMVKELDTPTPQIRIEAHIVETTKDTARELGIQWGGLYHGTGGDSNYWITPGANTDGVIGESLGEDIDPTTGMAVDFPAALGSTGLNLGFVFQELDKYILDVELSALEEEGKVDILSRPSITTLDNQPAMIEAGKEVPYQTTEGAGADKEVKIEWKKATLRLEVTPYVIDGKTLKMEIEINKDELDFANTVDGNPTIITKKAETNVVLFDGQTTVIGGLSKEVTSGYESGVPFLKDIPLLGYFFKGKGKANEMDELLIFITPRILKQQTAAEGQQPEN